jgi:hypothetical protein
VRAAIVTAQCRVTIPLFYSSVFVGGGTRAVIVTAQCRVTIQLRATALKGIVFLLDAPGSAEEER